MLNTPMELIEMTTHVIALKMTKLAKKSPLADFAGTPVGQKPLPKEQQTVRTTTISKQMKTHSSATM